MAPLIGLVLNQVTGYFSDRQKIKAVEKERKDELKAKSLEVKLEGIKNATEADMRMDASAEQRIPWADDVTLIVVLLPLVLAFVPSCVPHIMAGFEVLEKYPEWLKYIAIGMMISIWGYRRLLVPVVEVAVTAWAKSRMK